MTTNDFRDEQDSFLNQIFDPTTKGFDLFWTVLALLMVFLVLIGIM